MGYAIHHEGHFDWGVLLASVANTLASVAWVKRSGTQVLVEGIARTRGLYGSQRRYV